jgi:hypothetical protein
MSRYIDYKNKVLKDERSNKLNFDKVDNRFYYVYRITDLTNNEHYYGSRVSVISPDEDIKIYGSTSKRKKAILESPENYRFKIVKIFNNNGDKICYESFLHNYFNVKLHNKFWNESNQTPFGFDTTGLEPHNKGVIGNKLSEKTKSKLSHIQIKRWSNPENRERQSKKLTGIKRTPEQLKNYTHAANNRSDETIEKIRQAVEENRKKITVESHKKISQKRKERCEIKIKCPHCGKEADDANYTRWHGDNCKLLVQYNIFNDKGVIIYNGNENECGNYIKEYKLPKLFNCNGPYDGKYKKQFHGYYVERCTQ